MLDDEFTELVDGDFPRVDLVGKAANGVKRFLIAKGSAGGVIAPDVVQDLITKAEASTASMNDRPDSDFAYVETGGKKTDGKTEPRSLRHFPIYDAAHVRNALSRASQSPFGDKAMPKIRAAAEEFGVDVAKADLDASVAIVDAPGEGDPLEPGSGAWEAVDAATAMKWTAILSRARNAVQLLAGREEMEAFRGTDDGCDAWDLDEAACAIDCAIDILAPYAMGEKVEAELLAEVGKSMAGDYSCLDILEGLVPIAKAGRVLSTQNESRIREAVNSLQQVLSSLPAPQEGVMKDAPIVSTSPHEETSSAAAPSSASQDGIGDEKNQEYVRTPAENPVTPTGEAMTGTGLAVDNGHKADGSPRNTEAEEKQRHAAVSKADDASLVAVFSQGGKMLGVVDASKIQMVQTEEEPEAAPEDLTPAPPTAGVENSVMKAEDVVKAALAANSEVVKALEDRVAALEAPAPSRILTNGARPPADLRGLDAPEKIGVLKSHEDLINAWERTVDVTKRAELETQMNEQASAALSSLRESQRQR